MCGSRATPDGNPYAHPVAGLKLIVDLDDMSLLEIEDSGDPGCRGRQGEYVPALIPGLERAHRSEAARDHPARGRLLHARRQRAALAAVARCASASTTARGSSCIGSASRTASTGRVPRPAGRAPDLVRRDGRALPRPHAGPRPPHRLRHRRVGPGLHDDVAGAGLRLPRRDHLPRRRTCTTRRGSRTRSERDLPARGGRRRALEARRRAHRRRGPANAADGDLGAHDRRELRVPRLLAVLPGRRHRVRDPRHRDHGHDAVRRRDRRRPTAPSSTPRPTRRSTSTSSSRGSTWRSTATRTPSS